MHLLYCRENRPVIKILMGSFVLLGLCATRPVIDSYVYADAAKQNNFVTIVTAGTVARLCPHPGCGPDQHITRIPEGTVLKIESAQDYAIGTFKVKWFEVAYKDKSGWISIHDTDQAEK